MEKKVLLLVICFFFLFAAFLNGAELKIEVIKTATIDSTNKSFYGRLLFKFDLPSQLEEGFIDYAEIIFKSEPNMSNARTVVLGAYPLTRDWEENDVAWDSPWTDEGGDYIDSLGLSGLLLKSKDYRIALDITQIVRLWVKKSLSNYGLVLIPLESEYSLKLLHHPDLPDDVNAEVRIFFTAKEKK